MKARNEVPSDSNRHIIDSHQYQYEYDPSIRVYQLWKGSNRFFLNGRLIFGPDARSLFLTVFLILAPVILFSAFVSQRLIVEFHHNLGNLIVAICIIFTIFVIILLFLTSGRDPGIIPRNQHPPDPEEGHVGSSISSDWPSNHDGAPSFPPTKDVIINGHIVKVKYCQTCMLYRPPRCSHCSICNNCVERFDHHCPWVGQCIGKRNYRLFFMFVSSTTLLCLYVFAFCWTTYENFRYRYDRKTNPYNRGCARNFVEIFLSKIPSSKNNFRAKVKGESSSVSNTPMSLGHLRSLEMAKTSIEMEMGKRHGVAAEDFEDLQSQMDSVGGLERCGTEPKHHTNWDHKANWEITPDIQMLAAEFGMGYGTTDRQKIHGRL
ncbi:putative S-acyltransferase [Morus notabilis]|uniref:S-acyltransferase n=1 Tax=Morus notabilis TaxID=981085 RepID=W9SJX5_9ROSA|nr:putative S-acyltransferase [Morus notabilis]